MNNLFFRCYVFILLIIDKSNALELIVHEVMLNKFDEREGY